MSAPRCKVTARSSSECARTASEPNCKVTAQSSSPCLRIVLLPSYQVSARSSSQCARTVFAFSKVMAQSSSQCSHCSRRHHHEACKDKPNKDQPLEIYNNRQYPISWKSLSYVRLSAFCMHVLAFLCAWVGCVLAFCLQVGFSCASDFFLLRVFASWMRVLASWCL